MPKTPMPLQESATIVLGAREYEVVPQSLPYIRHHLGPVLESLANEVIDAGTLIDVISDKAHEVLRVFIPDLMGADEWNGVGPDGEYDEQLAQRAPTAPQVRTAVQQVADLNGFDLVKGLGKIVDPTVLRDMVSQVLRDSTSRLSLTSSSPSTPPSDSTPSSTTSPPGSRPNGLVAASG